MTTTRRNLFKFVGGTAVGGLLTPAPNPCDSLL